MAATFIRSWSPARPQLQHAAHRDRETTFVNRSCFRRRPQLALMVSYRGAARLSLVPATLPPSGVGNSALGLQERELRLLWTARRAFELNTPSDETLY
jgi:hypothetical protein